MKIVQLDYTPFKALLVSKGLLGQYKELSDRYELFGVEGGQICWETTILKDSDEGADFEASHKSAFNKPLEIKAGAGRPMRVAASPQPINTIQKFKGFQFAVPANTESNVFTVTFPSDVYLRGGHLYITSTETIDSSSALRCDVHYTAYNLLLVSGILDNVHLIAGMKLDFLSAESMYLPDEYELRFTVSCGAGQTTPFNINVLIEYFV